MAGQFEATIRAFAEDAERKAEAIFKQSAQDVIADAQTPVAQGGRLPVDTGFLRNSLQAGLNGSTALDGVDSYVMTIAGAELGDVIEAGWTADYAKHVEYGTQGRQGRFFMRGAAQKWPQIVRSNEAKVRG